MKSTKHGYKKLKTQIDGKMTILPPKAVCKFNAIHIKTQIMFFAERKTHPKIHMESQGSRILKKNKAGRVSHFLVSKLTRKL